MNLKNNYIKKTNKLILMLLFISTLLLVLLYVTYVAHSKTNVTTYAVPEGAPITADFTVSANGKRVGLYSAGYNTWKNCVSYGSFDFSGGSVTVAITVSDSFTTYKLVPDSLGITSTRVGNIITFSLDKASKVSLVLDGNYQGKSLHVFAEAPDTDIPSKSDPNVMYYSAGYTDLGTTPISVGTGKTVYLEPGAFVKGRFLVESSNNVIIRGRGVLYDNWGVTSGNACPIVISNSFNVTVQDIIVNKYDPHWSGLAVDSHDITLSNYKAVSPIYTSSDGFDISNCQNVSYNNCFFHVADDCIAIKGHNPLLANSNITIQNCQFWSDANNIVCLGVEAKALYYDNITVKNCDVLYINDHHYDMGAFSIEADHGSNFTNILFEDIRVEANCNRLINYYYTESWYSGALTGDQSGPGYGDSLTFRNITVTGTGANSIKIHGWDEGKQFNNIKLENIKINGKYVSSLADSHFDINRFVKSIIITTPSNLNDTAAPGLDFSSVQGTNNWFYKQGNGTTYTDMTWNSTQNAWVGAYTNNLISASEFMQPDTNDAVRAWKAPYSGTVQIKGHVNKWDITGGDGVKVKIMKNDIQIWPSSGWESLAYNDKVGLLQDFNIKVSQGDYIYYVVNQNSNSANDNTFWDTSISYTCKYNSATDFAMYQGGMNWGYKEWNGSSYLDMIWNNTAQQWRGLHPYSVIENGSYMNTDTNDTVRTWTAPKSGTVNISGVARKVDTGGGDGVNIKILQNNTKIWPSTDWQNIAYNDSTGVFHNVTVKVVQGDTIYFVLNEKRNNLYDLIYWCQNIEYKK